MRDYILLVRINNESGKLWDMDFDFHSRKVRNKCLRIGIGHE